MPLPEGLIYRPDFISEAEEESLAAQIRELPFANFEMHGVAAKRRVAHFGWLYGYQSWRITPGPPPPGFLIPLRDRASELLGSHPEELAEALVTEYSEGAGIGWHRDAPMFGEVAGISLLTACRMRFRRGDREPREKAELLLLPRSVYALTGPARSEWQHSIPPVGALRYSITFRTLRKKKGRRKPAA